MFALLAVALTVTGCIEFERQTVTYEHDAAADTLLIHQTYHGLYGADDVTQLSEKEREQLADVMSGQRTFFFANWIFELNIGAFKDALASSAVPETDSLKEAQRRATTNLLALLVANVRVENGKFYLNDQGQPCGTQRVTIRNVRKLLTAGNDVIRRGWEVEMRGKTTAAERELINASLARPGAFLTLTGQQLRFRWPYPKPEFDKLGADDPKLRSLMSEFVRQGGSISLENGEVHLRFGRTDAQRETVTLPMAGKESYRPNAAAHLREKFGLTKDFDPKQDAETFFKAATKPTRKP
jgi:hypothetical protein